MKTSWIFCRIGIIVCSAVLVTAYWQQENEDEEAVLVDNKCQCVKVTSKFVPDRENPQEKVLERNIHINVPLGTRENISDPTSPARKTFVYKLSKLCNKCDSPGRTKEPIFGQDTLCNDSKEPCYTYDRTKCYTSSVLFSNSGKTKPIETALTPESCYPD